MIETDRLLGALRSEKCPRCRDREPGCLVENQPMTHYEPRTIESTDIPTTADVLGVDGDGRTHFATSAVGGVTIYVAEADGVDIFELAETPLGGLEEWIDHVGTLRGWNRLHYTDDFGEHVVETLAEGLEA